MCINVVQIKLEHLFEELMLMMMEEYQTAQLLDGDMQGPPPDIQGSLGVKALWRMWARRKGKERANSSVSSLHLAPDSTSANLLLPLLAKKKKDALMHEWTRRSTLRNKTTQTHTSYLYGLAHASNIPTQTTPSPGIPLPPYTQHREEELQICHRRTVRRTDQATVLWEAGAVARSRRSSQPQSRGSQRSSPQLSRCSLCRRAPRRPPLLPLLRSLLHSRRLRGVEVSGERRAGPGDGRSCDSECGECAAVLFRLFSSQPRQYPEMLLQDQ